MSGSALKGLALCYSMCQRRWDFDPPLMHRSVEPTSEPARVTKMSPENTLVDFAQLEHNWADAIVRHDEAALERILHPDYQLIISAAPERPVSRVTWLQMAVQGYDIHKYQLSALRARRLGDVAVVSCLFWQHATVNGVDRSGTFFIVDIWSKSGDEWRATARFSSHPEPPSASSRVVTSPTIR
jgi:Domain of unknown function (DUF4440)